MERISELIPRGSADIALHRGMRRSSARYPLQAEVTLLAPAKATGFTINVSEGGLRVVLDRAVSVGEFCVVIVQTGPRKSFQETARVVWSRELEDGCLLGLEFTAQQAA